MLLWITYSIYAIFSLIIQNYFTNFFLSVTSRNLIKYPQPANLPLQRITKNVQTRLIIVTSLLNRAFRFLADFKTSLQEIPICGENFRKVSNIEFISSHQRCSVKKVFLEMSQNSHENTCARVFFNKVESLRSELCLKRDSGTGAFL